MSTKVDLLLQKNKGFHLGEIHIFRPANVIFYIQCEICPARLDLGIRYYTRNIFSCLRSI